MLSVPQYILEKLRCSICGNYLSSKPVVVRGEDEQICGKCYKLLPADEKKKCVRQIGFESVAEMLVFPCRYSTQGCIYTYKWCDEKDHEVSCPFRSFIRFSSRNSTGSSSDIYYREQASTNLKLESNQLIASLSYNIKDGTYLNENKNVKYSLNIKGNCESSLVLRNNISSSELSDVEITMDGILYLGSKPEIINSQFKIVKVTDSNIYETLTNYEIKDIKCCNCGARIPEEDSQHCLLGHSCCISCKGNVCVQCIKILDKDTKPVCKNYRKGCRETLDINVAHKHEINCQFNDTKCVFDPCNVIDSLVNIKEHIKTDHSGELYLINEINKIFSNKDEILVFYCYNNVFKVKYFYYKHFVEFNVTLVGSSEDAENFYFEVTTEKRGEKIKMKCPCSNWNNLMLERGIVLDKEDLLTSNEKKRNVNVNLKILNKK